MSKHFSLSPALFAHIAKDAGSVRSSDVVIMGAGVVDLGLKALPYYKVYLNIVMALANLGMVLGSAVKITLNV